LVALETECHSKHKKPWLGCLIVLGVAQQQEQ
jgi:hypothetical protein